MITHVFPLIDWPSMSGLLVTSTEGGVAWDPLSDAASLFTDAGDGAKLGMI